MGVPAFFRWLTKKYPSVIVQAVEEKCKKDPFTDKKVPVDTSKTNPNGVEFDNLYLDMNGIIHPCTHPEDRPAPKNEDEMMLIIFEFIDRIFSIVRPRKLLYMAIDGVAPRAKMNQQRSRRFRAAKDTSEKDSEIKRLRQQIVANGGQVPNEKRHEEKFDSNCITPGTPFMHKLAKCLRYYVNDRLNNDPGWKDIKVILSDANVPGEGEHKIMDYIRRQRANPDHDPNTHHVLCGADADLIMLGLATHEPYFTIIREEFKPDRPRPCEICAQFGHETKECTGLAREKNGKNDELNQYVPSECNYIFVRLSVLREYLQRDLYIHNLPFKYEFERVIDDWVFLCFFVGNDFLPHLPSLEIREGAIDRLVGLYKNMLPQIGAYLTDSGTVNLKCAQSILAGIGQVEDDIFKKRQEREVEFKRRQKEKKQRYREGLDDNMPRQMPDWMKTGPFAPTPLMAQRLASPSEEEKVAAAVTVKAGVSDDAGTAVEASAIISERKPHKRKHDEGGEEELETQEGDGKRKSSKNNSVSPPPVTKELMPFFEPEKEPVGGEQLEEDDDAKNDPVRLWEDGWRQRYYQVKFNVSETDNEFAKRVAAHYTTGLCWVLKYYYQGVPSWNWYFPYHYAPFASDFFYVDEINQDFVQSEPFNPFEQLMAVFPAASKQHIPPPFQKLMFDPESSIIDFYPEDFQIDLNGKKQSWQGVALLPFVDEKRLKKALKPYYNRLNEEEVKRNQRGQDILFVNRTNQLYDFLAELYNNTQENSDNKIDLITQLSGGMAGKVWCDDEYDKNSDIYKSPLSYCCPDIKNNKVICVRYKDPEYDDGFIFKACVLPNAKLPEPSLKPEDFRGPYRPHTGFNNDDSYRQNRDATAANRMLKHSMNDGGYGGGGGRQQHQQSVGLYSSAYGGQSSVYGAYRTYSSNTNNNYNNNNNNNYNNNNNNNNYRQRNRFTALYDNQDDNGGNNNNNFNNNRNNNYNNDRRNNQGYSTFSNFNYNNNNNNRRNNNDDNYNNNNYNNNRRNFNNNNNNNNNDNYRRSNSYNNNNNNSNPNNPNNNNNNRYNR